MRGKDITMSLLDIKGQQTAVEMIEKFITNGNINSSFLFYGGRGIGKHTTALNMTKALNCTGSNAEPWLSDDTCESCKKIEKGIHPDVVELVIPIPDDSSQMNTIVQTIEWLNSSLFEGRQKVLIIDDASELNIHAQNAMLKTLEEPPPWATILFITSSHSRLLPTVQSRLIRIGFNRLSAGTIKQILKPMTKLTEEELDHISLLSDGGIRYLALEDVENDVKNIIGGLAVLKDPASVVKLAEKFKTQAMKEHFDRVVDIILSFMIDAVIISDNPGLIRNNGFQGEIQLFAKEFDKHAIINAALSLEEARAAYELNVNPQMIMEHVLFTLTGDTNGI